jgi:hypothetical protein
MIKQRSFLPLASLALAFLSSVVAAQTPRAAVVLADGPNKKEISCPFSLICDSETPTPAFAITNTKGVAIQGAGAHTGVFGLGSGDPAHGVPGIGVAGIGDLGVFASGHEGFGLTVASSGPDIMNACASPGANCQFGSVFRMDFNGRVFANGGFQTGGADVAEFIQTVEQVEPGDVVEIDARHAGQYRKAAVRRSSAVAGVVSTKPGLTMNSRDGANTPELGPQLALIGRVRVKVSAENGAIHPGDLLVSSATPGYAMRAGRASRPGTIFGKALESLDKGQGVIEMLVWSR